MTPQGGVSGFFWHADFRSVLGFFKNGVICRRLAIISTPTVREKLSTRYGRFNANKEDELKSSEEKAFVAFKIKKQYKGSCGYCGK